jgi:hypothetical protein
LEDLFDKCPTEVIAPGDVGLFGLAHHEKGKGSAI